MSTDKPAIDIEDVANPTLAIASFSHLLGVLKKETLWLLDVYPTELKKQAGEIGMEAARDKLHQEVRDRIDNDGKGREMGQRLRAAFPTQDWKTFFATGKQTFQAYRTAVHDAVAMDLFEKQRPDLEALRETYLKNREDKLNELRAIA